MFFCTEGTSSCGLGVNKTDDKIIKTCKQMKKIIKVCTCKQIKNLGTFVETVNIVNWRASMKFRAKFVGMRNSGHSFFTSSLYHLFLFVSVHVQRWTHNRVGIFCINPLKKLVLAYIWGRLKRIEHCCKISTCWPRCKDRQVPCFLCGAGLCVPLQGCAGCANV